LISIKERVRIEDDIYKLLSEKLGVVNRGIKFVEFWRVGGVINSDFHNIKGFLSRVLNFDKLSNKNWLSTLTIFIRPLVVPFGGTDCPCFPLSESFKAQKGARLKALGSLRTGGRALVYSQTLSKSSLSHRGEIRL